MLQFIENMKNEELKNKITLEENERYNDYTLPLSKIQFKMKYKENILGQKTYYNVAGLRHDKETNIIGIIQRVKVEIDEKPRVIEQTLQYDFANLIHKMKAIEMREKVENE